MAPLGFLLSVENMYVKLNYFLFCVTCRDSTHVVGLPGMWGGSSAGY
jgi:hypothetical protein